MSLSDRDIIKIKMQVIDVHLLSLEARRHVAARREYVDDPHMVQERRLLEVQIKALQEMLTYLRK